MCNVSERYFYPRHIVISEDHLQSCIWMVPPIIKEATCSVVIFSRALCFFETSTCSHLLFSKVQSQFSIPVAAILWYIFGFRHVYIEQYSLFDNISCSHPFVLWYCHYFTTALEVIYCVTGTVLVSRHLIQPLIITSRLWLIQ